MPRKKSAAPNRPGSARSVRRFLRSIAALLAAFACAAGAQALYKWTDKDGRVHYTDKAPKEAVGAVTRIEIDPATNTTLSTPPPKAQGPSEIDQRLIDLAAKKRAVRDKLEADLKRARAKVDAAKAALAAAVPEDSERQVIQQRAQKNTPAGPGSATTGGMLGSGGMLGAAPRSNCRTDGNVVTCPTVVPGEAYYERVRGLEEALREAETELGVAEQAYRRGVD